MPDRIGHLFPVSNRVKRVMMICHCNGISDKDIHAAMDWMRAADPDTIITPGKVFRALGRKTDCAGCLPLFLDTMQKNTSLEGPVLTKAGARRMRQVR